MGEKSDALGGQRTVLRHGIEGTGVTALGALVIEGLGVKLGFSDNAWMKNAMLMVFVGAIGSLVKFWHENGISQRLLNRFLPPLPPPPPGAAGSAAAILAALLLSGCAVQLGTAKPQAFNSPYGETIIACEIRGISFALGDADICRNVEGGKVSKTAADMVLGVVRIAGGMVGAFFHGFGGAGSAMEAAAATAPAPSAPAPSPPGIELPKLDGPDVQIQEHDGAVIDPGGSIFTWPEAK